jgi:hypothetical protein
MKNFLALALCLPIAFAFVNNCFSKANEANKETSMTSSTFSASQHSPSSDLVGVWGGTGISLEINESGAELNYDCAHGSIEGAPVRVDQRKFTGKGQHFKERPGPTREDQAKGEAAEYSFTVEGDSMTLTVSLPQSKESLGPYSLKKGKYGRVRKCM